MSKISRRNALKLTAAAGATVALVTPATAAATTTAAMASSLAGEQDNAPAMSEQEKAKAVKQERERVMAVGMTEAEADCWQTVADAAGKFFALPKLHTMDDHEVAHAIHVIQHKLLSRPAYRRYLELAKSGK